MKFIFLACSPCQGGQDGIVRLGLRPFFAAVVYYMYMAYFFHQNRVGNFERDLPKKRNENRTKIGQVSPGVSCRESVVRESGIGRRLQGKTIYDLIQNDKS